VPCTLDAPATTTTTAKKAPPATQASTAKQPSKAESG
jgi:hypothetical protein